jgi:hypothetical protein
MSTIPAAFAQLLLAAGPSPEIPSADRLYDFLIGSWDLEVRDHLDDGSVRTDTGECHAAWVLEGRAVQDVWIAPAGSLRTPSSSRLGNRYGTTLRVYDPKHRVWRVTWINPVSGAHNQLVGRREGNAVVQEGRDPQGQPIRWIFRDITAPVLHWVGEASGDEGRTWRLQTEFFMRRK